MSRFEFLQSCYCSEPNKNRYLFLNEKPIKINKNKDNQKLINEQINKSRINIWRCFLLWNFFYFIILSCIFLQAIRFGNYPLTIFLSIFFSSYGLLLMLYHQKLKIDRYDIGFEKISALLLFLFITLFGILLGFFMCSISPVFSKVITNANASDIQQYMHYSFSDQISLKFASSVNILPECYGEYIKEDLQNQYGNIYITTYAIPIVDTIFIANHNETLYNVGGFAVYNDFNDIPTKIDYSWYAYSYYFNYFPDAQKAIEKSIKGNCSDSFIFYSETPIYLGTSMGYINPYIAPISFMSFLLFSVSILYSCLYFYHDRELKKKIKTNLIV